jgi:hypothetical protein
MWGPTGAAQLDGLALPDAYTLRLASRRGLIDIYDTEVRRLDAHVHRQGKETVGIKLTPKQRESDEKVHHGPITTPGQVQGPRGRGPQAPHPRGRRASRWRGPLSQQSSSFPTLYSVAPRRRWVTDDRARQHQTPP